MSVGRDTLIDKLEEVGTKLDQKVISWKKSVENSNEQPKTFIHDDKKDKEDTIQSAVEEIMSDILSKVEKENFQKNVSESESVEKFQIIFTNLDFFVRAKHMTSSKQNRSFHWVNLLAVKDRVTGQGMDNTKPIMSVYELLNIDFIPSLQQNQELLADFIPHVAKVIADNYILLGAFF